MEETKQASELDSNMAEMLKVSDRKFKTTMINKYSNGKSKQHVRIDG